ncbi:hypothetical protein J5U23_00215 [Saccharolobus shibatae B12]|uniref:Uncharacterized protein n=1 Tax=Saccharolobus shibatae (strain ATCC 51178 / DSM 5389 / JCM 8931 / NBRC 15437 / B12) TaxID=523848 RepID=A0A8F5BL84_SACSH|nr:hypothetical protein J5U23_00215 [Saccharolobus shibatae B12]
MDICLKARNDEEVSRALKLNYNCVVYTKPLNNVLTFIPDQYIYPILIYSVKILL